MKSDTKNRLRKLIREEIRRQNKRRPFESTNPRDMRNEFIQAVRGYGEFRNSFPQSSDIKSTVNEIGKLVEMAETVTLSETQEWFDNVTVNRHMKQLGEAYKVMQKTGTELVQAQQRFESAYEDIGQILGKYYEV